jgi:hypothetical protein
LWVLAFVYSVTGVFLSSFFLSCAQADGGNSLVRRVVLSTRSVATLAGRLRTYGHADGVGTNATLDSPSGIAVNSAGTFALVVSNNSDRMHKSDSIVPHALSSILRPTHPRALAG